MRKKDTKKKWTKYRHRVIRNIAYVILAPYCKLVYGVDAVRFQEQRDEPYLILFNHQTAFDQFFVGISFRGPVYYLASEDIFSNGWVSSLIRWLIAPIPIKKQTTDVKAVINCMKVVKEGGTLAIAPEGNRTYSGKTLYMNPAIAPLARKLNIPIALYRIEGGFGIQPRWSDVIRRGKMRAYVSRVLEPEDYRRLSDDELYAVICDELAVDEGVADAHFRSSKRAEYLERAMYVCPYCGLSVFESHGNEIECKKCGRKVTYGTDKRLTGIGFHFPFSFVTEWYAHQEKYISELDFPHHAAEPLYRDKVRLSEVIVYKKKVLLRKTAELALYGDRITVDEGRENELTFPFHDVSAVTVLGRNKLNIYCGGKVWQCKGDKRFNALKYVNLYFHYKNRMEEK